MTPASVSFSVITTSRNAARYIGRCLDSVAGQSWPHVEHLVVDGSSSDGTQNIVRQKAGPSVRLVSEADSGIYDAMNKGLRLATGDYILFLGADDYLADPRVLADVAEFLQREALPDIVYGNLEVRDGRRREVFRPPPPSEALDFLICGCLPHQSTVARRRAFDLVGAFDTRWRYHADYDWFLRAVTNPDVRVLAIDRVIGSFQLGGASSQLAKGQSEVYSIQNSFPPYQQPDWVERRLDAWQRRTLELRLALGDRGSFPGTRIARKVAGKLRRWRDSRA